MPEHWTSRRNRNLISQTLSAIIPAPPEDMIVKYPSLLDVPFIAKNEILITREIGAGSFGRVYHGIFSFQDVAMKQLTVRNFTDELDFYEGLGGEENDEVDTKARQVAEMMMALEKEVGMLSRISFPKVVQFYGVCFDPPAIVTEYCARGSLFDLIAKARQSDRVAKELSWERRLRLAMDAASGMNFLHKDPDPIIHRDLKSPNLLVDEHYNCKVADFNTAGFVDATEISKYQANNPRWLAPEIAEGEAYTKASDVYPFGIILWELMTWQRPFEFDDRQMSTFHILIGIVHDKLRPDIVQNDKLEGGPCPVYDEYITLMQQCWDQEPASRPSYTEISVRLKAMSTRVIAMRKNQQSSPRHRPERSRTARTISPTPRVSRSPRAGSPFSQSPSGTHPRSIGMPTKSKPQWDQSSQTSEPVPLQRSTTEQTIASTEATGETCPISPFQNGPPSTGPSTATMNKGTVLANPPSFSTWSTPMSPSTQDTGFYDYSIVDSSEADARDAEKTAAARRRWSDLSKQLGLDQMTQQMKMKRSAAFQRWDSIRTAIFGEPTSAGFQEHFDSFLKGDETTELVKRLKEIENKGSPGLRILRALVELREKRIRESPAKVEDKPSGWSLVKHLMLINLPSTVHPMWKFVSENIFRREEPIAESDRESGMTPPKLDQSNGTEEEKGISEARRRAQDRWKMLKSLFLSDDYQRTKPVQHPYWEKLREFFFACEDDSVPSPSSAPSTSASVREPEPISSSSRSHSKWDRVKQLLLSKVVLQNYDFLAEYAKTPILEGESSSKHSPVGTGSLSKIRRLPVVDEEPPSRAKWDVVRGLLLDGSLGREWRHLSDKARTNRDPPKGTEWEIFRWLFFENRHLRNESQWTLIKDLLLKTEHPSSE